MFAAYLLVWIGFFLYLLSLSGRQRRLSKELEALKGRTSEGG